MSIRKSFKGSGELLQLFRHPLRRPTLVSPPLRSTAFTAEQTEAGNTGCHKRIHARKLPRTVKLAGYRFVGRAGNSNRKLHGAAKRRLMYLDVIVPKKVFVNGGKRIKNRKLAPVMVSIHGGGFFIGDKAILYPSQGFLASSNYEMIFVSMNYRLKASNDWFWARFFTCNWRSENTRILTSAF